MDIIIDNEFSQLLPSLTEDEYNGLEQSIITDGCRDPLVIWRDHNILIDGHNRYDICSHNNIPYQTVQLHFDNRADVVVWIIQNQLHRRNCNAAQRIAAARRAGDAFREVARARQAEYHGNQYETALRHNCDEVQTDYRTDEQIGQVAGVSRNTVHKAATVLDNGDETVQQKMLDGEISIHQAYKETKRKRNIGVHFSSASSEWYTPAIIIDRVLAVLGTIDLDPCSNTGDLPNIPATNNYTLGMNGLSYTWAGTVYMNPPYGNEISLWVDKLATDYEHHDIDEAIALIPARTDTAWFRRLKKYPRCFIWGRLKFSGSENSAPFPSMVVYFGSNQQQFVNVFSDIGDIYIAV